MDEQIVINLSQDQSTSVERGASSSLHTNNGKSFANVLKERQNKFNFPERDQAIIFDSIDSTKKNDYIFGVGGLIGPKNIIFASRVSNGRICIYLSSKELLEKFMNEHGGITINENFIVARRLVSPAKRIILSNVSPSIPHDIVEKELKRFGLKVVSPISFIRAGVSQPEYSHVLSFRRQVYIVVEENDKIPESILIQYKENYFRIFLTNDELRCFNCNKIGHIAVKCTEQVPVTNAASEILISQDNEMNYNNETPTISWEEAKGGDSRILNTDITERKRRQAPSVVGTLSTEDGNNIGEEIDKTKNPHDKVFAKPKKKKKKISQLSLSDDSAYFAEFQPMFDNQAEIITFEQTCSFLREVKGKENPEEIALLYTTDILALVNLLIRIIQAIQTSVLKARIKRLVRKLQIRCSLSIIPGKKQEDICSSSQEYASDNSEY